MTDRALSRIAVGLALSGLALGAQAAEPQVVRSTEVDRKELALTVYNGNFGLVRESRTLPISKGIAEVEFVGVASTAQPESVIVRAGALRVLEQNYRFDLLSPQKLLEKFVGKSVKVLRWNESKGRDEELDAIVLSAGEPPILKIGDGITFSAPGRISFPEVPGGLIAKPALVWKVEALGPKPTVDVSYLAEQIGWRADYVLSVNAKDDLGDLAGWVTLTNQSGTAYPNAKLQLVAGEVQRIHPQPPQSRMKDMMMAEASLARAPQFSEESLFEYHLYTLERPTTILDNEQKQIALLDAEGIAVKKRLVLRGESYFYRGSFPEGQPTDKVTVSLEFENSAAQKLGIPLPKGIVRVYKSDSKGGRQFLGEDQIEHTARDEKLRIRVGDAFDVVGERKQTEYKVTGRCSSESAWSISVRNHKDEKVEVDVVEPAHGDWEIVSSSIPAQKDDAHTFRFPVPVAARGETKVTYRVRVKWC